MWWPAGVCCQLLATTIQTEEKIEPSATISVEKKCICGPTAVPAEDEHGEEAGLEEEGEDALGGERRAEDVADEARVGRPVRAELELHDDAGGDADGEVEREDLGPELRRGLVEGLLRAQEPALEVDQHHTHADRQRREDVVEHDGQRELEAGQQDDVHCTSPQTGIAFTFK